MRTTPCSPGLRPVPVNFRSVVASPVARLPRISTGSLVLIATSNFQSRNGGPGREKNSGRSVGGCGAGLPGRPMGIRSMFFRNRLFVSATLPLTRRRRKWSRYPDITIGARGKRIVSSNQHALGSHFQIENRIGQFGEGNADRSC